jgi:hypothetical protein
MLDRDLAILYEVKSIALRQQVKRNKDRFPTDFMFQLNAAETRLLVSQNVIEEGVWVGRAHMPLRSKQLRCSRRCSPGKRALQVNIAIMRAFVRMREMLMDHQHLLRKVELPKRPIGFVPAAG